MPHLSSSAQRIPVCRQSSHSSDTSAPTKPLSKGCKKNWTMYSTMNWRTFMSMLLCASHTWMPACKKHYASCLLDPLVNRIVNDLHSGADFSFLGPPRSSGHTGVIIQNNWIAPNTTLHMPVYAMHRDPNNFGLGDKFIPERWLDDADVRKSAAVKLLAFNRDAFVPFSAGYSSCVGKHLALQNIKYATFHPFSALFHTELTNAFLQNSYWLYDAHIRRRNGSPVWRRKIWCFIQGLWLISQLRFLWLIIVGAGIRTLDPWSPSSRVLSSARGWYYCLVFCGVVRF